MFKNKQEQNAQRVKRKAANMGVYVLTDGEGNYIRKDVVTDKYVPIRSFKQAQQWDNSQKAHSVLNNSLLKQVRSRYAVQIVDTENTVEKDDMSKQKRFALEPSRITTLMIGLIKSIL